MEDRSLTDRLRRNWRWLLPVVGVVVAIVAWLAFGVFGIHTLFIDDKVSEDGPQFDSGASNHMMRTESPTSSAIK